jgi:hypothetical protein
VVDGTPRHTIEELHECAIQPRLGAHQPHRSCVVRVTKRRAQAVPGNSASLAEVRNNGVVTMTELRQAELAKELGFRPATAKGWSWEWQRCGRYEYRKCLTHSTNPDHLISRELSPTDCHSCGSPTGTGRA